MTGTISETVSADFVVGSVEGTVEISEGSSIGGTTTDSVTYSDSKTVTITVAPGHTSELVLSACIIKAASIPF